jgi:hypothetical protein
LPRQALRAEGLQPEDLHRAEPLRLAACLERILQPLAAQAAEAAHRQARNPALAPVRGLAAQADALHRVLRRRGYPVLLTQVEVMPLRQLWRAWRA